MRSHHLFLALSACVTAIAAMPVVADQVIVNAPPSGQVTVYRDDWGVPHIYAEREEDGFYGLGYAQAEDALDPLLKLIALTESKSAAVNGSSMVVNGLPLATLEWDLRSLTWRHVEMAKAGFPSMSPQLQRNYAAYTAGLEQYLSDHPEKRPAWLGRLEPWLWVAMSRTIFWPYKIKDGMEDCAAAGGKVAAMLGRPDPSGTMRASNEWVIAPWRTADNAMMVLSDPHGEIDGALFHEFGMKAGDLNVAGFAIGPLMLLTNNHSVSWGMTTGAPDVSDCFEVEVDSRDPRRYKFDGEWREMLAKTFRIDVKDSEPVTKTVEYTMQNGLLSPVVAREGNKAYVVSTTYMDHPELQDEVIHRMNLARSVDDVRKANELLGLFPQNLMAGDRFGHSYYLRAGRTPRRPEGYDWTKPVAGNSSASAWQGLHPAEDLVQISDPISGYMQNNNVPPDQMIDEHNPISRENYPDYIFYDVPSLRYTMRGRRTKEILSRAHAFTVADAKAFAVDEKWFGTERWQAALSAAASDQIGVVSTWEPDYRKMLDRLLTFDGFARQESYAALAYFHWRTAVRKSLSSEQRAALNEVLTGRATLSTELARSLIASLAEAIAEMKSAYGTLERSYGEVFRIGRDAENSWPVGGGPALDTSNFNYGLCTQTEADDLPCPVTMRAFLFGPADGQGRRLAISGSRALRLVIFTDPLQSYSLHNFGQSSMPGSLHYDDQARELVSKGQLKSMYFNSEELQRHVSSYYTLKVQVH